MTRAPWGLVAQRRSWLPQILSGVVAPLTEARLKFGHPRHPRLGRLPRSRSGRPPCRTSSARCRSGPPVPGSPPCSRPPRGPRPCRRAAPASCIQETVRNGKLASCSDAVTGAPACQRASALRFRPVAARRTWRRSRRCGCRLLGNAAEEQTTGTEGTEIDRLRYGDAGTTLCGREKTSAVATLAQRTRSLEERTDRLETVSVTFSQEAARDRNLRSTFRSTGSCRSSPCSRRSASRRGIYALTMGDEAMQVLNLDAVRAL